MQELLWRLFRENLLLLHQAQVVEIKRMAVLMAQSRATPIDLADASLVAAAEVLGTTRIFTLDHHFHVYRLEDSRSFEVVS